MDNRIPSGKRHHSSVYYLSSPGIKENVFTEAPRAFAGQRPEPRKRMDHLAGQSTSERPRELLTPKNTTFPVPVMRKWTIYHMMVGWQELPLASLLYFTSPLPVADNQRAYSSSSGCHLDVEECPYRQEHRRLPQKLMLHESNNRPPPPADRPTVKPASA